MLSNIFLHHVLDTTLKDDPKEKIILRSFQRAVRP